MRRSVVLEALGGEFDREQLKKAVKGIDIIGKIAIIKIPREWEDKRVRIGELLLPRLKGVEGVFRQTTPTRACDKTRGVEWLAGDRSTITSYIEHGCRFKVDVLKVYFSPRLSHERLRIAELAAAGETVVNMFAGVGTFSIVMAKISKSGIVYSIDKSPEAFELMLENVSINRLNGKVMPILGDAKDAVLELEGVADRVLMPLPELALNYIGYGLGFLKSYGKMHIYLHQAGTSRREALETAIAATKEKMHGCVLFKATSGRVVRSVGRKIFQIAIDMEVEKIGKRKCKG